MTITVFWETEKKTMVQLGFERAWSWAEYDKAVDEASSLIRSVPHNVGVIFNLLQGPDAPHEYATSHLLRSVNLIPSNATSLFIVGGSPSAEAQFMALFRSALRLSGRKVTSHSRLEGVYALVVEQR